MLEVVLLNGKCQILAGKELIFRNVAMEAFLSLGREGVAFEADFGEKPSAGCIITAPQHPG
jgi:hypothetical protein